MKMIKRLALCGAVTSLLFAGSALAIVVTPTADTTILAGAVLGSGITPTSVTLSGNSLPSGELSSGTYTNASGTYGIGGGVVLSSGDVADYSDGPNGSPGNTESYGTSATTAQEALLDPITGGTLAHFDVTQLDILFDVDATTDTIFFDVVFGSDEYDEFVGTTFIDAFGIYLNSVNIALFGGLPINIDHPDMAFVPGTELDGILDPFGPGSVMNFSAAVLAGSIGNTLTFIIADSGDTILDSTAYISGFGSVPPTTVPTPGTLALLSLGLLGLGIRLRMMGR